MVGLDLFKNSSSETSFGGLAPGDEIRECSSLSGRTVELHFDLPGVCDQDDLKRPEVFGLEWAWSGEACAGELDSNSFACQSLNFGGGDLSLSLAVRLYECLEVRLKLKGQLRQSGAAAGGGILFRAAREAHKQSSQ